MVVESIAAGGVIRYGALFANTWNTYKKRFFPIFGLTAISFLPGLISFFFDPRPMGNPGYFFLVFVVIAVTNGIFTTTTFLAVAVFTAEEASGEHASFAGAVKKAFARLPAAIMTILLMTIMLIGWFLLLIIPGIIKSVRYSFALHAVALRGVSNLEAVSYSQRVVKGFWWDTVFAGIMLALPGFIVFLPFMVIAMLSWQDVSIIMMLRPVNILINILVVGFLSTGYTLLFLGLEHIKNCATIIEDPQNAN